MVNRYLIDVNLDFVNKQVIGVERIFLTNMSKLQKGLLVSFDLLSTKEHVRLKLSARGEDIDLVPTEFVNVERERLFYFKLPESMLTEKEVMLESHFSGRLPEPQREMVFLVDSWHPKIVMDKKAVDDYEVTVTVPHSQTLISTGLETKIEPLTTYQMRYGLRAEGVKDFGLIASDRLRVIEGKAGDVVVMSYYLPETKHWGIPLLDFACDAIDFYRGEFGFYPQKKLSIMPGHEGSTGGWPVAANIVAIHDLDKLGDKARSFGQWIVAHEIGHQYWGEYVLSSEFPCWLNIGLGIYMDRCYAEARKLEVNHHEWFMQRYLRGLKEGVDTTVIQPPEKFIAMCAEGMCIDYDNIIVHGKGYAIVSMLEQVLGKDLFRQVFYEALRRFKHRDISSVDFQVLCEEVSGEDLDWFFYQWLHTNRYLCYKIASTEQSKCGETYLVKVLVERLGDACMPIPVQATFQDGRKVILWTNRALRVTELTFTGKTPLQKVELDPEGRFPLLPPESMDASKISREVYRRWRASNWEGVAQLFAEAKAKNVKNHVAWFLLGLSLYDVKSYEDSIEAFQRVCKLLKDDPSECLVAWSYIWQGHNLDLMGRRGEAITFYQKAIETGNKDTMQHGQYDIGPIDAVSWAKIRLTKPFTRINSKL